ncbi:MAG: Insecticidal toxin complex protein TcdA4 [Pseudomonadota bacterium]|jgi:hypothetical protein
MSDSNNDVYSSRNTIRSYIKTPEKLAEYSLEEVYDALQDNHSLSKIKALYEDAGDQQKKLQAQKQKSTNRGNPQLQRAGSLEIRNDNPMMTPDDIAAGASAGFIPERYRKYVSEGDIASQFSPAAYLTALYKHANGLHSSSSPYNIDNRRPDIGQLLLSQENLANEVSTLTLSNEMLTHAIEQKTGDNSVNDVLKAQNVPFDFEFEKWQQILSARKTTAAKLWPWLINEQTTTQLGLGISPDVFQQLTSSPKIEGLPSLSSEKASYYGLPLAVIEETLGLLESEKSKNSYPLKVHQILLLHKASGLSLQTLLPFVVKQDHLSTASFRQLHQIKIYLQRYGISETEAATLLLQNWSEGIPSTPVAALLAECHQLTVAELTILHPIISDSGSSDSYKFIEGIYNTTQWLKQHQLNIAELVMMTATKFDSSQTAEIERLVTTLQANVKQPELNRVPLVVELSTQLAFILGLTSTATVFLLYWLEQRFDGVKVEDIWQEINKLDTSKPFTVPASVIAFCHQLAQLAMISQRLQLTDKALVQLARTDLNLTIVTNNKFTADGLMELSRYRDWMATLSEQGSTDDAALTENMQSQELLETLVKELWEAFSGETNSSTNDMRYSFNSFKDTETKLYWQQVAKTLHLPVASVLPLSDKMHDYKSAASHIASLTDAAFDTLSATDQATIEATLAEKQSNALSHYYLTELAKKSLRLKSRDDLYSYLLIDNQVSAQIKTSRIAEATSNLQLYINRCRYQAHQEPAVNTARLKSKFFADWDRYNKGYSTWASINQLACFPENYIDPALRIGQTSMMETLLQSINQGQLTADTVEDAFKTYLTAFEEIADLTVISGYHDDVSINQGLTYFIGESLTSPPTYYWRTVDHAQFSEGKFPATAWSEWKKITAAAAPYNQLIRPIRLNGRLYLLWLERREDTRNRKTADSEKWLYELKLSHLRYDNTWSTPFSFEPKCNPSDMSKKGLHCTASGTPTKIHVCLYDKSDNYNKNTAAELWVIDDMMKLTKQDDSKKSQIWVTSLGNEFDTPTERRISNLYSGEEKLSIGSNLNAVPVIHNPSNHLTLKGFSDSRYGFSDVKIIKSTANETTLQFKPNPVEVKGQDINLVDTSLLKMVSDRYGVNRLYLAYSQEQPFWVGNDKIACVCSFVIMQMTEEEKEELPSGMNVDTDGNIFKVFVGAPVPTPSAYQTYDRDTLNQSINNMLEYYPIVLRYRQDENKFIKMPQAGERHHEEIIEYFHNMDLIDVPDQIARVFADDSYDKMIFIYLPNTLTLTVSAGGHSTIQKYPFSLKEKNDFNSVSKTWDKPIEVTLPISITEPIDVQIKYSCDTDLEDYFSHGSMIQTIPIIIAPDVSHNYLALKTNKAKAQYLEWDKQKKHQVRLNTLFAKELVRRADIGINNILSPETQLIKEPDLGENNHHTANQLVDFSGSNALYFWELFYYTPMLVMQRLLQEQNFDLATHWLNYVFNPADQSTPWKTRPLKEDITWNATPLDSTNPDAVAQADPMHYKLSTFMRLLDLLLERGDHAYRQQKRDTLAEAKMWYVQALSLLGTEPAGSDNPAKWSPLPLKEVAGTLRDVFLPQQNTKLQNYNQTLKQRLYNLRNGLSIDGQQLMLPLFAAPVDAKELMNAAVSSSQGGAALPTNVTLGLQRFPVVLDSAKAMVGQLMQFGGNLSSVIERQDAEQMAVLMQTQGIDLLALSVTMQKKNLEELNHEATALDAALTGAKGRYQHYKDLYDENISPAEQNIKIIRMSSAAVSEAAKTGFMTAAALEMVPNIYGMSTGGSRYGAVANALAIGSQIAADMLDLAAEKISAGEMYRRRRADWGITRDNAKAEIEQLTAQREAMKIRYTSAELQVTYLETQQAQHQAQWALMTSKFTNRALYTWMRGRLAALYFQYYDLTVSRCLRAQYGYQWETLDTTTFIKPGAWQGTYAGLLCGEALMLNLAKMDAAYQDWDARAMQIERTVSLAELYRHIPNSGFSLTEAISDALNGTTKGSNTGKNGNAISIKNNILDVSFNISELALAKDYPSAMNLGDKRFFQQISVSLPALLGPYQDVQAVLRYTGTDAVFAKGCNAIAISRGMNDSGQFQLDFNDSNYLPFEGINIEDSGGFVLRFPINSDKQKALLQSLSDIILHIRYTIRS